MADIWLKQFKDKWTPFVEPTDSGVYILGSSAYAIYNAGSDEYEFYVMHDVEPPRSDGDGTANDYFHIGLMANGDWVNGFQPDAIRITYQSRFTYHSTFDASLVVANTEAFGHLDHFIFTTDDTERVEIEMLRIVSDDLYKLTMSFYYPFGEPQQQALRIKNIEFRIDDGVPNLPDPDPEPPPDPGSTPNFWAGLVGVSET